MRSRYHAAQARLDVLIARHIHLMCNPAASVRSRKLLFAQVNEQQRILDARWRDLRKAGMWP